MNILIIGGGNMGVTYARAFVNPHVVNQDQLAILKKDKDNRLAENLIVKTRENFSLMQHTKAIPA